MKAKEAGGRTREAVEKREGYRTNSRDSKTNRRGCRTNRRKCRTNMNE
jgi:hypothetical protein